MSTTPQSRYIGYRHKHSSIADRQSVLDEVDCPTCLVKAGRMCIGVRRRDGSRRSRSTLHIDRYYEYDKMQKSPSAC